MLMFSQGFMLADLALSLVLIFLWVTQREDRHALFWGIGQLALMAMWLYWGTSLQSPARKEILLALFVAGLMAYWYGTRAFCGLASNLHKSLPIFALMALGLRLVAHYSVFWAYVCVPTLLGAVLLGCGILIARGNHPYRSVGLILVARGAVDFAFSFGIYSGFPLDTIFVVNFVLKEASTLGLVYAAIDESHRRYRATVGSLTTGFIVGDEDGFVHFANDRIARLFGCARGHDLIGQHISQVLPAQNEGLAATFFRGPETPNPQNAVIWEATLCLGNGTRMPVELVGNSFLKRGMRYLLVQLFDITQRKQQEKILERAANFDALCGLHNRHALDRLLREALDEARRCDEECALLFLDLDHFKRINDSMGHTAGDQVLRMAATRLQTLTGPHDILARFGGDEFVIVRPGCATGTASMQAWQLAQRIIHAFASPLSLDPNSPAAFTLFVTPSIGIASSPKDGLDPDSLLMSADIAMYAAKAAGRNEIRLFDATMDSTSRDALLIEDALHQALDNNEFRLVYQPIVDSASGRLRKVEALIRWKSAALGEVSPDRFIPVAEENGMIVEIGHWVMRESCRQAREWAEGPTGPICVSFNVSAWQLVDQRFLSQLDAAINDNGIVPQQIEVEITERVLIEEATAAQSMVEALHVMGVGIALDDFGTGYSSLSYLTRFQFDTLKIDRSFITRIETSDRDSTLVRTIIAMGQSLGLQMVAEGIETPGQARLLADLGCQNLQGYLYSRPLPPEKIQPASHVYSPYDEMADTGAAEALIYTQAALDLAPAREIRAQASGA